MPAYTQQRCTILNFSIDYIFLPQSIDGLATRNFPLLARLPTDPPALLARVKRSCIENECGSERGSVTLGSIMTPKTPPRCVYLSVRTQPARRRIKFGRTSDLTATRGSYNAVHIVFHAGNFAIEGSDLGVAGSSALCNTINFNVYDIAQCFCACVSAYYRYFYTRTFRLFVEILFVKYHAKRAD